VLKHSYFGRWITVLTDELVRAHFEGGLLDGKVNGRLDARAWGLDGPRALKLSCLALLGVELDM
jgi:hypothetical protein